jgi:hypothetical protein
MLLSDERLQARNRDRNRRDGQSHQPVMAYRCDSVLFNRVYQYIEYRGTFFLRCLRVPMAEIFTELEAVIIDIERYRNLEEGILLKRVRSGGLNPLEQVELDFYVRKLENLEQEMRNWFEVLMVFPIPPESDTRILSFTTGQEQ